MTVGELRELLASYDDTLPIEVDPDTGRIKNVLNVPTTPLEKEKS